jgi:hypothetical protein
VLHGRTVTSTAAGNPLTFAAGRVAALDRAGRFAGHIITDHTAYLGHSFGGAAPLQACATDPRCAAAADLDGTAYGTVVDTGLHAPLMVIGSDGSCTTGTCRPATADDRTSQANARALLPPPRARPGVSPSAAPSTSTSPTTRPRRPASSSPQAHRPERAHDRVVPRDDCHRSTKT